MKDPIGISMTMNYNNDGGLAGVSGITADMPTGPSDGPGTRLTCSRTPKQHQAKARRHKK